MKLLFYDKFLDSLIALPQKTQKKVIEFQKKFRENSKSSAIHLEPIIDFKDKSLRTARIDQNYRAILKSPKTGDTYYLLWVDQHDKAYEWAKYKVFQWNDNTQSMQVFTSPDEVTVLDHSPQEEAKKDLFKDYSDEQLMKVGVPDVLLSSIRDIINLDDLEKIEEYIPADVFENLFYLADGASIESIITEVNEGKLQTTNEEDQVSSINNQRSFIELTDDTLFNEVLEGKLDKWKYYLHPSQSKVVYGNYSGTVKITGGAGTGKTVAAIHRLKFLSQNRKTSQKILFTTYTKALTENLKKLIDGFDINKESYLIQNIDALSFRMVQEYNLIEKDYKVFGFNSIQTPETIWDSILDMELVKYGTDFLVREFEDVILSKDVQSLDEYLRTSRVGRGKPISRRQRVGIWKLIESYIEKKKELSYYHREEIINIVSNYLNKEEIHPFEYCLVDELQDFSNVELRFVRALVDKKENDLFLVGDPLQKIYAKSINFSSLAINVRGKKSKRLRINYRTTEEIKKLAISIIKNDHYDNFDGEEEKKNGYVSLFHGLRPVYNMFNTKEDEISYVLEKLMVLTEGGYDYSSLAISARTKDGLKDFQSAMHNRNIPYQRFENGVWSGAKNGIKLLTFHGIKGLEFKQVFLIDVNKRNCPKIPFDFDRFDSKQKEDYLRNENSLLYVAITRAIENVEISGVGQKTELIGI